ncbi:MAG: Crp/Fnr family transcriptional regulator [Aquabacterium sp.]|nr:MAG: Crp/Fnr family transcriptional regulator [Aquabacterium sp.]
MFDNSWVRPHRPPAGVLHLSLPPTLAKVLIGNPWFASVPAAEREALCAVSEPLRLAAGAMLFRQGDRVPAKGGAFFALLEGRIKLSTLRADGREAILGMLEPGNWFGEISLLDDSPRAHDTTALVNCSLLAVPRAAFAARMRSAPFAQSVAALVAGRVRSLYDLMEDATLRSSRARVARRLLTLARGDATRAAEPRTSVVVPQEALAMMLGVSRQTLSKELQGLVHAGAIALGYRRIEIRSREILDTLAADDGRSPRRQAGAGRRRP